MKRKLALLSLLFVLCLLVTSCSSKSPSMDAGKTSSAAYSGTNENGIPADGAKSDVELSKTSNNDLEKRKLIKDVSLSIQTKAFDDFMSNLQSEINKHGGFIQKSDVKGNSYASSASIRYATIVVRIPADKLDAFTSQISSLGNVISKSESVQDITMDYVDIESHIKALKTEQESLLKLLEKAGSLNDILTIQNRLTEVRSELESYESKLRTYDDLVSYSTVTMEINEVERVTQTESKDMWQEIGNNLSNNLYAIGQGIRSFIIWFVSALPYLLIIAAFALVIFVIIRISIKRSNRKIYPPIIPPTDDQDESDL